MCIPCGTLLLKRLTRCQSFADDSLIPLFEVVNTDFATHIAAQAFVRLCSRGVAVLTSTSASNETGVHISEGGAMRRVAGAVISSGKPSPYYYYYFYSFFRLPNWASF